MRLYGALAAVHPGVLCFELDQAMKHLFELGEEIATAYWSVVVANRQLLERELAAAGSGGMDQARWQRLVMRTAIGTFKDTYAALKERLKSTTVSMLATYITNVLALGAAADRLRARSTHAGPATRGQQYAAADLAAYQLLEPVVADALGAWCKGAEASYACVADGLRASQMALALAQDASPLSDGPPDYSGEGSYTSEDELTEDDSTIARDPLQQQQCSRESSATTLATCGFDLSPSATPLCLG